MTSILSTLGRCPATVRFSVCLVVLVCSQALLGCARESGLATWPDPVETGWFTVMTYNLGGFTYLDRSGDGQAAEMKPVEAQEAVLTIIEEARPDILALQEIGPPSVLDAFRAQLAGRGVDYPFTALLQQEGSDRHLAVLSRFPLTHVAKHTTDRYRAGDTLWPIKRGVLEVDLVVSPAFPLKLFVVQLKSKAFHPAGQTEMRRSEARLLANHVRRAQQAEPQVNFLIVGDMNDHIRSAPLRHLLSAQEEHWIDLRPADEYGEIWTGFEPELEMYHRYDYALASPALAKVYLANTSRVVRHPLQMVASHRRPLLLYFQTRPSSTAGDLEE